MNPYIGDGTQDSGAALPPSFDAFAAEASACGCDETLVREWGPGRSAEIDGAPAPGYSGCPGWRC